ncbi:MAG: hypothetical protein M1565_01415 [Actinobacteria bacterium]|nr:hypothetical protein [Actinomycetota bacterium]MCL5735309.1 hypothetical protein [Actinomycetota bacterium]
MRRRTLLLLGAAGIVVVSAATQSSSLFATEPPSSSGTIVSLQETTSTSTAANGVDTATRASQAVQFPNEVRASGPVPEGIEKAAAQGDPEYQIAKLIWEQGGLVTPVGNGQYLVRMPSKIPEGFTYPTQSVEPAASPNSYSPENTPMFLAPDEFDLYQQLMTSGASFQLVQESDGYRHIHQ